MSDAYKMSDIPAPYTTQPIMTDDEDPAQWARTPKTKLRYWFGYVWRRDKANGNIHDSPWWEYRTERQLAREFLTEQFDEVRTGPSPFTKELWEKATSHHTTETNASYNYGRRARR